MLKNLIIIFALLIISVGCTYKLFVTSKEYFKATNAQIQNELGQMGYFVIGEKTETKNEVSVEGVSLSRYGYGSAMKNNFWTYGEYSFMDSTNNEVTYFLKYQEGPNYVQTVEVTGCMAKKNHDEICGQNGVVKANINNMNNNPDAVVEVTDPAATAGLAVGISSVALLIILLVILL